MRHDGDLIITTETDPRTLAAITEVGGYLVAHDGARVSLPACTTVGGYLYAHDGARVSLPVCTTVGDGISAYDGARVSLPVCTTVGGYLVAREGARVSLPKLRHTNDLAALRRALARRRLTLDDGILCRIVRRRGNVSRVRRVGQSVTSYLVTDGTYTAHGATLAEARADLRLKQGDRDTTPYQGWTRDTVVSQETAIAAYRAITGACREGVRDWLAGRSIPARVSVARILDETAGQYGHAAFAAFVGGAR